MAKKVTKKDPRISELTSKLGTMGGKANFNKYGLEGPKGMRARGAKGGKARWAKRVAK